MTDFDNGDRTGIGAMARARDMRFRQSLQGLEGYHPAGPMMDPKWDAYFQTVAEAAGNKPVKFGYASQPSDDLSRDPEAVASQLQGMPSAETFNAPSTQLGTPYEKQAPYGTDRASLKALRKQLGTR